MPTMADAGPHSTGIHVDDGRRWPAFYRAGPRMCADAEGDSAPQASQVPTERADVRRAGLPADPDRLSTNCRLARKRHKQLLQQRKAIAEDNAYLVRMLYLQHGQPPS
eukprot:5243317-Prymnesium_polylepis.1